MCAGHVPELVCDVQEPALLFPHIEGADLIQKGWTLCVCSKGSGSLYISTVTHQHREKSMFAEVQRIQMMYTWLNILQSSAVAAEIMKFKEFYDVQ